MSINADQLKVNPGKNQAIAKEVSNILAHIDDEIKTAYQNDAHNVVVSVPITFRIANMSNSNAQRIVYYKILESLLNRNFIPEIELEKDKVLFHIRWLTEEEEKEIVEQNLTIAKHRKKPPIHKQDIK